MKTIKGIRFIQNFTSQCMHDSVLLQAKKLQIQVEKQSENGVQRKGQNYLSKQHNLRSDQYYKIVSLMDSCGKRKLNCQYFEKYGEQGHKLSYFIGNQNIPHFLSSIIGKIESLQEVQMLKNGVGIFDWKFTLNQYDVINKQRAGFPFHVDTPSNGDVTAIYTVQSQANIEFKKDQILHRSPLHPDSLLLLSGEGRWDWMHRVLAKSTSKTRMSLVFGCFFHKKQ